MKEKLRKLEGDNASLRKKLKSISVLKNTTTATLKEREVGMKSIQEENTRLSREVAHISSKQKELKEVIKDLKNALRKANKTAEFSDFTAQSAQTAMEEAKANYDYQLSAMQTQYDSKILKLEDHHKELDLATGKNSQQQLEDITSLREKLQIALSSNLEAQENRERLAKVMTCVADELTRMWAEETLALEFTENIDKILLDPNLDPILSPLFSNVSKFLNAYTKCRLRESEEGLIVSKSINFAHNSKNLIASISGELKAALDVIYSGDSFVISQISVLERNGVIPVSDITQKLYNLAFTEREQISSDYTRISPPAFDLHIREKAYRMLSKGVLKLVDTEIFSVFEEANTYALNVMERSPIHSPKGSPSRRSREFSFRSQGVNSTENCNDLPKGLSSSGGEFGAIELL